MAAVLGGMLLTGAWSGNLKNEQVNSGKYDISVIAEMNEMEAKEFIEKAAKSNLAEIEFSKVAQQKASNSDVKSYAQTMQTEHTKANDELRKIAQKKNITFPTSMDQEKQTKLDNMRRKSGAEFDRAYMDYAVNSHSKSVEFYQKASKELKDNELKTYADNTLTSLKNHHQKATQLNDKLKGTASSKGESDGMSREQQQKQGQQKDQKQSQGQTSPQQRQNQGSY